MDEINKPTVKSYRELFWNFKQEMLKSMATCYFNQHIKDDKEAMNKTFKRIVKENFLDKDDGWIGFEEFK